MGEVGAEDVKWREGKGWSEVEKGHEGPWAEVAVAEGFVCMYVHVKSIRHIFTEEPFVLVLLLTKQLAIGWLYSLNVISTG